MNPYIRSLCHKFNNDLVVIMLVLQETNRTSLDDLRALSAALRMQQTVLELEAYSVPVHDATINCERA